MLPAEAVWAGAVSYTHLDVYKRQVMEADFDRLGGHQGYVCGSPAMVESALKSMMGRRLFPRDIFHEDFFNASDKAAGVGSPLIKR